MIGQSNPIRLSAEQTPHSLTMIVELTPDAIGLRSKYRGLILHLNNVAEPIFWDFRGSMPLVQKVPGLAVLDHIGVTCYGVASDNTLHLVYRNWGNEAVDGLPRSP